FVLLKIALRVVEADRPETVYRDVVHIELVNGSAVVLGRRDIEIDGFLIGIAAPTDGRTDEVPYGVDLSLGAARIFEIGNGRAEREQRVSHFLLARWIPVRQLPSARARLFDLNGVLQGMHLCNVLGIGWIDQRAQGDQDIAGADLLPVESVAA